MNQATQKQDTPRYKCKVCGRSFTLAEWNAAPCPEQRLGADCPDWQGIKVAAVKKGESPL